MTRADTSHAEGASEQTPLSRRRVWFAEPGVTNIEDGTIIHHVQLPDDGTAAENGFESDAIGHKDKKCADLSMMSSERTNDLSSTMDDSSISETGTEIRSIDNLAAHLQRFDR